MVEMASVLIFTESEDAAEEFVREYVIEAVDRLPTLDCCEYFTYVFQGHPEEPFDSRVVRLLLKGDVDTIIEHEESQWGRYIEDGLVTKWEKEGGSTEEERQERYGEKSVELRMRFNRLETEIAKLAFEEFESFPAPVNEYPDESSRPVGWWRVNHNVMHKLNYSNEEELEAYLYGIEHTLRNFAEHDSPDRAEAVLDEILERLEKKRPIVREGRVDS